MKIKHRQADDWFIKNHLPALGGYFSCSPAGSTVGLLPVLNSVSTIPSPPGGAKPVSRESSI